MHCGCVPRGVLERLSYQAGTRRYHAQLQLESACCIIGVYGKPEYFFFSIACVSKRIIRFRYVILRGSQNPGVVRAEIEPSLVSQAQVEISIEEPKMADFGVGIASGVAVEIAKAILEYAKVSGMVS